MPLADTNPAATLVFDSAVHRALSRRLSDTPWPHNGAPAPAADRTPAAREDGPDEGTTPA